ncbi:MAG: Matrixin [Pseudomonadota bacterium]|jgi:hypothetical protein
MYSDISRSARTLRSQSASGAAKSCSAVLSVLLCCLPAISTQAASWEQSARVAYIGTEAPVSRQALDAALDYAIAAWSARIDMQIERSETTVAAGYNKGLVVIRWIDAVDMLRDGGDILGVASTKRWLYKTSGHIAGAEIILQRDNARLRDSQCLTHVLVHELGHALGLAHLSAENSVMHAELESCHHTLTADDIAAAPYPQHICHAELLPGFDIYIPVINIGERSWSARLEYAQGRWIVSETHPVAPQPVCDDTHLEAGTLVLDKVWTQQHVWQAELENVDGYWRLKSAR